VWPFAGGGGLEQASREGASRCDERPVERRERRPQREFVLEHSAREIDLRRAPGKMQEALGPRGGAAVERFALLAR